MLPKRLRSMLYFSAISIAFAAITLTAGITPPTPSTNLAMAASPLRDSWEPQDLLVAASPNVAPAYTVEGTAGLIEKDGTVIVRTTDKPGQIVYIDDSTKISRNGKPATLSDLKPGDQVQAIVGSMRKALEFKAEGP